MRVFNAIISGKFDSMDNLQFQLLLWLLLCESIRAHGAVMRRTHSSSTNQHHNLSICVYSFIENYMHLSSSIESEVIVDWKNQLDFGGFSSLPLACSPHCLHFLNRHIIHLVVNITSSSHCRPLYTFYAIGRKAYQFFSFFPSFLLSLLLLSTQRLCRLSN